MKNKVTKEAYIEDKYQKKYSAMNTKNEDANYMYSTLVKDKDNTRPSKATEETK